MSQKSYFRFIQDNKAYVTKNFNEKVDNKFYEECKNFDTLIFGDKFNQDLLYLHNGLKVLHLGDDFNSALQLPPTLEWLIIGNTTKSNFNQKLDILPQSLKVLVLTSKKYNYDLLHLPSDLKILFLYGNIQVKLPNKITYIEVFFIDKLYIPKSIKYLKIIDDCKEIILSKDTILNEFHIPIKRSFTIPPEPINKIYYYYAKLEQDLFSSFILDDDGRKGYIYDFCRDEDFLEFIEIIMKNY